MVLYGWLIHQVLVRHHHGAFRYGVAWGFLFWFGWERESVCVCTLGMCVRVWLGKEENLWAKACVLQRERKRIYARDLHKDDREHTYRVYE